MKIPFTYGAIAAAIGVVITLVTFFAGLNNDPAEATKHLAVSIPLGAIAVIGPIVLLVLAVRAWRDAQADRAMSYGRGVWISTQTAGIAGFFGGIFHFIYLTFINPAWHEAMLNMQLAAMESKPMPAEARAMAEKIMNITMNPAVQGALAIPMWMFGGVVVGLIAAAVLKREPAIVAPPPVIPGA